MSKHIKKLSNEELLSEYVSANHTADFNNYDEKSTRYLHRVENELLQRMEADKTWNFVARRNY